MSKKDQTLGTQPPKCLASFYCDTKKHAIVVYYDAHLGVDKAKEYYGPWDTVEEAEKAAKDIREGKNTCLPSSSKVPVLACHLIQVFWHPELGMIIPLGFSGPYACI